jgi:phthalate 4,5-dioxygenase oxygenase subunit
MLSKQRNEVLTHVGPGTPMGSLFRQYWLPAALSTELVQPGGDPLRVLLLGEKLIAFRDSAGKVGLLANHCPHRGASLFFGRNEAAGLRCVYHGWQFDSEGNCVDMPNEPAESDFKHKVKTTAYPCVERGGLVWTYMGSRTTPPPLPQLEPNMLADGESVITPIYRDCNWLQALVGDFDTSHAGVLHFGSIAAETLQEKSFVHYMLADRAPRYHLLDTDAGFIYAAYRNAEPGFRYYRIVNFLFPAIHGGSFGVLGATLNNALTVPMDDEHTMRFAVARRVTRNASYIATLTNTTDWLGRFRRLPSLANDFLIDRDMQRTNTGPDGYTGIRGIPTQDQAVQESMGSIADRSREHLGTSDTAVIHLRRRLLAAVEALAEHGTVPPGVDAPAAYAVRGGGVVLPAHVDWLKASSGLRQGFVEHPELEPLIGVNGHVDTLVYR